MKNYATEIKDAESFILKYEVRDNKIFIEYALKTEEKSITYTRENEIKILERMKQQVLNAKETKECLGKERKKIRFLLSIHTTLMIAFTIAFMLGLIPLGVMIFFNTYHVLNITKKISQLRDINQVIFDMEKNLLFIEKEELLNKNRQVFTNPKLSKVTKKNYPLPQGLEKENRIFTINTIDALSYHELKKMLKIIEQLSKTVKNEHDEPTNDDKKYIL